MNINLVRDKKTGKSKGFCFICYEDQRSTILAVDNFNGIKVGMSKKRVLPLNKALSMQIGCWYRDICHDIRTSRAPVHNSFHVRGGTVRGICGSHSVCRGNYSIILVPQEAEVSNVAHGLDPTCRALPSSV